MPDGSGTTSDDETVRKLYDMALPIIDAAVSEAVAAERQLPGTPQTEGEQ